MMVWIYQILSDPTEIGGRTAAANSSQTNSLKLEVALNNKHWNPKEKVETPDQETRPQTGVLQKSLPLQQITNAKRNSRSSTVLPIYVFPLPAFVLEALSLGN
jgi:hypothetical protein